MCAYSHVHLQRLQDKPDVIDPSVFHSSWWTSASVVAGQEGFAADKIATDYDVGIYTGNRIASWARASYAMALSWPTAVPCDLKAYISIWITYYWHYLLPFCAKATCNVTVTFCYLRILCCCKIFGVYNFHGWCEPCMHKNILTVNNSQITVHYITEVALYYL